MAYGHFIALTALTTAALAAPAADSTTCSDGTTVSNAACCAFIPLAQDLQSTLFMNDCGEDGP